MIDFFKFFIVFTIPVILINIGNIKKIIFGEIDKKRKNLFLSELSIPVLFTAINYFTFWLGNHDSIFRFPEDAVSAVIVAVVLHFCILINENEWLRERRKLNKREIEDGYRGEK